MQSLEQLMDNLPQIGRVEWIGLRPDRGVAMLSVNAVNAATDQGLVGDRYAGKSGKRQVTLIQSEHITAIASITGKPDLSPSILRRNIVVSGINLLALKGKQFYLGDVLLEYTGLCHPCSKMEAALGPGGYNAMRGHGGINARVLAGGLVSVDCEVKSANTAIQESLEY